MQMRTSWMLGGSCLCVYLFDMVLGLRWWLCGVGSFSVAALLKWLWMAGGIDGLKENCNEGEWIQYRRYR
jgi:hypothetical protein